MDIQGTKEIDSSDSPWLQDSKQISHQGSDNPSAENREQAWLLFYDFTENSSKVGKLYKPLVFAEVWLLWSDEQECKVESLVLSHERSKVWTKC